jgi:hypothetical protein
MNRRDRLIAELRQYAQEGADRPMWLHALERIFGALLVQDWSATEVGEMSQRTYTVIMAPEYAERHPEVMERIAAIARYRSRWSPTCGSCRPAWATMPRTGWIRFR